jgi:predicted transcriptional regulator
MSPCHASAAPSKARLNAEIGTALAQERGRMLPTSQTAPVWRTVRLSILSEFYKMNEREGHAMRETIGAPVSQSLVTRIVSSYVRKNKVAPADIPNLIHAVSQSLLALGKAAEPGQPRSPAVPIRRSVSANYVVCLECGWRAKMLRRHLQVSHGLNPQDYRSRWKLAPDHPLTAPAYSEKRSALAKQLGFGQKRTGRRG